MDRQTDNLIHILPVDPYQQEAAGLMEELSRCLEAITGDSGQSSFQPEDVCGERAVFVIARDAAGKAVGCGAIRPLQEEIAEVKRMYAGEPGRGIGSRLLAYLEQQAVSFGYTALWLETRLVNHAAVAFYERQNYHRIDNYGHYAGHPESVCFEKRLAIHQE